MRLPLICSQCMAEDLASVHPIAFVTFSDDGYYETMCSKGHKSAVILQQQKFEVLFEIGAYAIIDGYYREAVSSFTSSLERFYEFFIKAYLYEKGIEEKVVTDSWKNIANQSERQYGAFIFLYTSEFEKPPKILNNKRVEFRNEVIHKGKIPTKDEAVDYGQSILDIIRPILNEVKEKFPKGMEKTIEQHLTNANEKFKGKISASMGISTIISLTFNDPGRDDQPLETAIKDKINLENNL